jgi:nucleoside-diphosphate-sugar epimerase
MKKKTILLTGATGFLGSYLLESFIALNFNVIILKRSTSSNIRINHLLNNIIYYNVDLLSSLDDVFVQNKIDIIVHTACSYGRSNESLKEIINTNLIFGINLMELGIKFKVQTFINTGSLLPRNINSYSLSKAQLTDWLKINSSKIQVINLKIEHMYGPKDDNKKFLQWLINEMQSGTENINLTSGIQKRDFIYVDDVVAAYNLIINNCEKLGNWNEFDIGTNSFVNVKDFVIQIAKELENSHNIKIIQRLKFGVINYREGDIMIPQLNNSKLLNLGWVPKTSLKEGIKKVLN